MDKAVQLIREALETEPTNNIQRWVIYAAVMGFLLFSIAFVRMAFKPDKLPMVIGIRDNQTIGGVAEPVEPASDIEIKVELAQFVEDWRSVSPDKILMGKNVDKAQDHIARGQQAFSYLTSWAQSDEKERADKTIVVRVEPVKKATGMTYVADWHEEAYDKQGGKLGSVHWRGSFVVRRGKPTLSNLFGIYITNADVSPVGVDS